MAHYDASNAQCLVYSFKDGLLSAIAHDLRHRATNFEIEVDDARQHLSASIDASSLRVECVMKDGAQAATDLSDGDKRKIEGQIIEDVLHAKAHPKIAFRSTAIAEVPEGFRIEGVMSLNGVERPLVSLAKRENGHFRADITIHQPDFGIKPFSAMMGTLKIKPDVIVSLIVPAK